MVEIKGMSFGYRRERLFDNLDLAMGPGNIYGLLGKNGAGKTTLLKIICGLRLPQEGRCSVLGHDPARRPAALLEKICFIPEDLYVPAIPADMFTRIYPSLYPRFSAELFHEYLDEFELSVSKRLSELSYGQKKKFLLAFGLASGCTLLLMDEPTNGLDIPSKSQFRRLLARAGGTEQMILISTHQVRDMENLIDPIIILDQGRIVFHQTMEEASRKLLVSLERDEPQGEGVLFSEKTLGGWVVVRERTGDEESRIDLETLFNAVTTSRDKVQALFSAVHSGVKEA